MLIWCWFLPETLLCTLKKSHLCSKGRDEDAAACSNQCLISWVSFSLAATRFLPEEPWGPALLVVSLVKGGIDLVEHKGIFLYPELWCNMNHRIIESYMERAFKGHPVQFPCNKQTCLELDQVAQSPEHSSLALNISRDRTSTTSLGNSTLPSPL